MTRRKKITMAELQALIARVKASGDTTKLLEIMRDESYRPEMRTAAAKAALPFHHSPISPIDDDDDDQ